MDKIIFTLNEIGKHPACKSKLEALTQSLDNGYDLDTKITISQVIDNVGIADAIWCLRAAPIQFHDLWRHFAVDCAEQVKHLMKDQRSIHALEVARRYIDGKATEQEVEKAKDDSLNAAESAVANYDANAAGADAAYYTANAATAAFYAVAAAFYDADLTFNVIFLAAAYAAADAAAYADADAGEAIAAAGAGQVRLLIEYCRTGERVVDPERFFKKLDNK